MMKQLRIRGNPHLVINDDDLWTAKWLRGGADERKRTDVSVDINGVQIFWDDGVSASPRCQGCCRTADLTCAV